MAVDAVGSVLNSSSRQSEQASVGQEDLFKILLAQLSYQDPLKPMDNQEFIAQLAQFTSLEQSRLVNENLESLLTVQSATQSMGLIGRTVEVNQGSSSSVGDVTTVRFDQGSPLLTIQTQSGEFLTDIRLSQVSIVR